MRIALVLAAALMAAPAFAQGHEGHGAGGHEGHDMSHMDDMSRFGAPGDPAKASRTVTVKATEIAYDLKSLDVKTGETITFVLVNDGTQDHELGIGDKAFFEAHRQMMAQMPGMTHAMRPKPCPFHRECVIVPRVWASVLGMDFCISKYEMA